MADVPPTPFPEDDEAPRGRQESVASGASGAESKKAIPRKKATGGTGATSARQAPPGRTPKLQKDLEELLATPSLVYSFMGDQWAAELLATRTPAMAAAWYELAQKNAAVKRLLEGMVKGSAMGGVFLSTAAVVLPLLQHHGLVPGDDPFAPLYPPLPDSPTGSGAGNGYGGPIVPPPPAPASTPAPGASPGGGGGAPVPGAGAPGPAAVSAAPVTDNGVPR